MSHSVTMSSTTLSAKNSDINSSIATYKTPPVLLKAVEVVLGFVCVGIAAHDLLDNFQELATLAAAVVIKHADTLREHVIPLLNLLKPIEEHVFVDQLTCRLLFLTVTMIFLTISLIQITWFPASLFTGPIKSRVISGVVYHLIGFGLHLAVSLNLLTRINLVGKGFLNVDTVRTVAIVGLVNAALYLLSTVPALWSFRDNETFRSQSSVEPSREILMDAVSKS